ncbi:nucleotidyltransferase family protein [Caproiciproducens faecalis]|uniref:Nucleotidyltransferase domain-containing protein n=1 Tax=Caproiciproducens faecalis TaxID=2820301 RepID=A0ABS7DPZ9_9FIRM|nr:nucleotidyltransferase domain-containing protein [Caproiciproducens faecalis]MBW7573194.1 nucleotidyltransferase domain-containing protein [Caproiciproducens faecalis]
MKKTIDEIRSTVAPIAEKYNVEHVYLFGSYARGDADENSDIDLRIDKGALRGMFALCGLYTELEAALNKKIDLLTTASLDDDFLDRIKNEEVLLYAEQFPQRRYS